MTERAASLPGEMNLRYPGQWYQAETSQAGLSQNGQREYDPTLGRYTQADPLGIDAAPNLYTYDDGDPLNNSDSIGLWQITVQAGAVVGGTYTFGNNGGSTPLNGQWNYGGYIGVGEGLSADIDIFDRGRKTPHTNFGIQGAGEFGLGPHLEAQAHALGCEPWWNLNFGLLGVPVLGASVGTEGVSVPTVAFGEAVTIGVGGTLYKP